MEDHQTATSPDEDFTLPWGPDPFLSQSAGRNSYGWRHHRVNTLTYKAKDRQAWEGFWQDNPVWDEPGEECTSDALTALRVCLYQAAHKNSMPHLKSVIEGLQNGLIPARALDVWEEFSKRSWFVSDLVRAQPGSELEKLLDVVVEKWPFVIAWSARTARGQDEAWRHPLAQALRAGGEARAQKMLDHIEPAAWLNWDNFYDGRIFWRNRNWFAQDASWIKTLASYDPRLLQVRSGSGVGLLEQAAMDHRPELVRELKQMGLINDPVQSMGLSLPHWAAFGYSEEKWDKQRKAPMPKSAEEIETSAQMLGQMLASLQVDGEDLDAPVAKCKNLPGQRRQRNQPKAGQTAWSYLEGLKEAGKMCESAWASVQQACMAHSTLPATPSSAARRARL